MKKVGYWVIHLRSVIDVSCTGDIWIRAHIARAVERGADFWRGWSACLYTKAVLANGKLELCNDQLKYERLSFCTVGCQIVG